MVVMIVCPRSCEAQWQLIDKVVQQVVLHSKSGDPDVTPLEIDLTKLGKQLVVFIC